MRSRSRRRQAKKTPSNDIVNKTEVMIVAPLSRKARQSSKHGRAQDTRRSNTTVGLAPSLMRSLTSHTASSQTVPPLEKEKITSSGPIRNGTTRIGFQ